MAQCHGDQVAVGDSTCGICPPVFDGTLADVQQAANMSSVYAPGKPKHNMAYWNAEKAGHGLYCGSKLYIKYWTLYAACYGNKVGHIHYGFMNPYGYTGLQDSGKCFAAGKAVGGQRNPGRVVANQAVHNPAALVNAPPAPLPAPAPLPVVAQAPPVQQPLPVDPRPAHARLNDIQARVRALQGADGNNDFRAAARRRLSLRVRNLPPENLV
jgi:hypothetical protein